MVAVEPQSESIAELEFACVYSIALCADPGVQHSSSFRKHEEVKERNECKHKKHF